ncbi:MAG: response regulator transcription factor [Chloroflexota bacterium]|nr:response regulator transcription factor [Chloroflexota bacterium]
MSQKILVVDDDPAIGDVLQLILKEEGYEVEIQTNGQGAWQLQAPFPGLLLLDIRLSGMDGRTICQHLKSQASTRQVPIIIISATKGAQQIASEAGADDFIAKPFELRDMLAMVTKYIR